MYIYCTIPSSLFTMIFFKQAKTVCLQEPSVPFCGVLNELRQFFQKNTSSLYTVYSVKNNVARRTPAQCIVLRIVLPEEHQLRVVLRTVLPEEYQFSV